MSLTVGSLFAGIGGFDLGFEREGFETRWFVEREPFCQSVLKTHWPNVPIFNDVCTVGGRELERVDCIVGGFPCQDLSVAGRRAGLSGSRSGLFFEFARILGKLQPRFFICENVPGLFSSATGKDFDLVVETLSELGYGLAWRTLDSQYFRVAQRRRRVFLVGDFGDGSGAGEILFEPESVSGNPPPRREARKGIAGATGSSSPSSSTFQNTGHGWWNESDVAQSIRTPEGSGSLEANIVAGSLLSKANSSHDPTLETYVCGAVSSKWAKGTGGSAGDECYNLVTHSLRADGFDASGDGTGRGTPIIPILEAGARTGKSTDDVRYGMGVGEPGDPMFTLQSGKQHAVAFRTAGDGAVFEEGDQTAALTTQTDPSAHIIAFSAGQSSKAGSIAAREEQSPTLRGAASETNQVPAVAIRTAQTSANDHGIAEDVAHTLDGAQGQCVAFKESQNGTRTGDVHATLDANKGSRRMEGVMSGMAVRRLTPRECERLQGFPDDWTLVTHRGKPAADGPRYKTLGNAVTVNVTKWIAGRVAKYVAGN